MLITKQLNTVNGSFIEQFKFANQLDYKIYYIALNKLYKTRDMRYFLRYIYNVPYRG